MAGLALLIVLSVSSSAVAQNRIIGVASVVDGDTIEIHGQRIRLRLTDDRRYCCGLEWFRDHKDRLKRPASQEPCRVGGDEYDRNKKLLQKLADGLNAGTAVPKLDVRENQAWQARSRNRQRLGVRARDAHNVVAEAFDELLPGAALFYGADPP